MQVKKSNKKQSGIKSYFEQINAVLDPETGIGLVDMGLIYDVKQDKKDVVHVTMTLTTPGCPLGGYMAEEIERILKRNPKVKDTIIKIVWEPAWNPDRMKPEVREMLGL